MSDTSEETNIIEVESMSINARASLVWNGFALFNAAVALLDQINDQISELKALTDDEKVAPAPVTTTDPAPAADPAPTTNNITA